MQTPGHVVVNAAALGSCLEPHRGLPIVLGALLPDLPIYALYAYGRWGLKLPTPRIWRELYPRPRVLLLIHALHSLPLALLGLLGAWALGLGGAVAFFASLALHSAADLPIHAEDAHRHLLPFSQYRFVSPLSYWDVRHHARAVAAVELVLVLGASAVLWRRCGEAWVQGALIAVLAWYGYAYVRLWVAPEAPAASA